MTHDAAQLIALLLAQRVVPRDHALARRALLDLDFRADLERRLAESGLRLLDNPFADHLAVALTFESEQTVFGQGATWLNNNVGLARDGVALLVLLWALIVLPKRERQWSRQTTEDAATDDMFGAAKPLPKADDASRGITESTLRADYARALGGWSRTNINLSILSRLGFIERRNKVILEGPLLDLAFDYETLATRIMDGALGEILAQRAAISAAAVDEQAATAADAEVEQ